MTWLTALMTVFSSIGKAIAKAWPALATYLLGRTQGRAEQMEDQRDALQEDLDHIRRGQKVRRNNRGLSDIEFKRRMRRWQTRRERNKTGHEL